MGLFVYMSKFRSPDHEGVLYAVSSITGQSEYLTSTNHVLDTSGGGSSSGSVSISDGIDTTLKANILKSDGTATGQNALLIGGSYLSVPFTTTSVQAVGTTDAANYKSVSVHITSQGTSSSIAFQGSNDPNSGWVAIGLASNAAGGTEVNSTGSANLIYSGGLPYRYFRLNVTGISAGTTAGIILFSTLPAISRGNTVGALQSGTWTVGANSATGASVPANAFYMAGNQGGTLTGFLAQNPGDGSGSNGFMQSIPAVFNGTNFDRSRSVTNATNSTGTGISAVGLLAQLDDTSPTSITENQFGNVRMSADRSLLMVERSTTPAQTSVAGSATSVSLLAANNARKGATITNDSSAVMYLKLGATASTTSYTATLAGSTGAPFAYYEVPFGYVGAIDAIWASATGNARITELT